MENKKNLLLWLSLLGLCISCNPTPQPIDFGADSCAYCKMSIVDQQHGAEMVTTKGKVYKYDAIECMIRDIQDREQEQFAFLLVCDYAHPAELVDATQSHFLISENIPSPMGAYLSAFSDAATARATKAEQGGEIYDWVGVQEALKKVEVYSLEK